MVKPLYLANLSANTPSYFVLSSDTDDFFNSSTIVESIVDPVPNNPTITLLESGVVGTDGRLFVIKYQATPNVNAPAAPPTTSANPLMAAGSSLPSSTVSITLGGDNPIVIPVGVLYTED
jgi:hypothetical protein